MNKRQRKKAEKKRAKELRRFEKAFFLAQTYKAKFTWGQAMQNLPRELTPIDYAELENRILSHCWGTKTGRMSFEYLRQNLPRDWKPGFACIMNDQGPTLITVVYPGKDGIGADTISGEPSDL